MNTWRMGKCGHPHNWGLCNGSHQMQDTQDGARYLFPEGNPLNVTMESEPGDEEFAGTRSEVIARLRDHSLVTSFMDGNVICKCGHVSQLVWFTEHQVDKVVRGT